MNAAELKHLALAIILIGIVMTVGYSIVGWLVNWAYNQGYTTTTFFNTTTNTTQTVVTVSNPIYAQLYANLKSLNNPFNTFVSMLGLIVIGAIGLGIIEGAHRGWDF